jgi:hypothetical protein
MSVQIVTMKTGERLITELKEAYDGEAEDKKGICLIFDSPYILSVSNQTPSGQYTDELQVQFSKWNPFSIDNQFKIPYDGVLAISNPDAGLMRAYLEKIADAKEDENESALISPEVLE